MQESFEHFSGGDPENEERSAERIEEKEAEMDPELREQVVDLLKGLWLERSPEGGVYRDAVRELSEYMLVDFDLTKDKLHEVEALHLEVLQSLTIEIIEDAVDDTS